MIVGIDVDIAKIRLAARADRAGAGLGCPLFAKREHLRVAKAQALAGPAMALAGSAMALAGSATALAGSATALAGSAARGGIRT